MIFEGDRALHSPWVHRSRGWQWEDACKATTLHTDISGRFVIDGLYPGHYTLQLSDRRDAGVRAFASVDLRPGTPTEPLVLRDGAPMPDALTVFGRVVDDLNRGHQHQHVVAYRYAEGAEVPLSFRPVGRVRADGTFELRGLTPGRWGFVATARGPGGPAASLAPEPVTYGPGRVDLGVLRIAAPGSR